MVCLFIAPLFPGFQVIVGIDSDLLGCIQKLIAYQQQQKSNTFACWIVASDVRCTQYHTHRWVPSWISSIWTLRSCYCTCS